MIYHVQSQYVLDNNRKDFSLTKLTKKYNEIKGNKISKSIIYNCLIKKYLFKYLKVLLKLINYWKKIVY